MEVVRLRAIRICANLPARRLEPRTLTCIVGSVRRRHGLWFAHVWTQQIRFRIPNRRNADKLSRENRPRRRCAPIAARDLQEPAKFLIDPLCNRSHFLRIGVLQDFREKSVAQSRRGFVRDKLSLVTVPVEDFTEDVFLGCLNASDVFRDTTSRTSTLTLTLKKQFAVHDSSSIS
jgi:hypothetical protein